MKYYKIPLENKTGHYNILKTEDVEFVNPISFFSKLYIIHFITTRNELLSTKQLPFNERTINEFLLKEAHKEWNKRYKEYLKISIPDNFIKLLNSPSKKEQINLLKDQSLTLNQLISLIFYAHNSLGFKFSQYIGEHHHNNVDVNELPKFIEVKDNDIEIIGKTNLSIGQLKQVVDHKKRTIAKFLDKKNEWHCFFVTSRSLKGEEKWKDGQPHFHYISDKFGIERTEVKNMLKNKTYKLSSLPHIDFIQ